MDGVIRLDGSEHLFNDLVIASYMVRVVMHKVDFESGRANLQEHAGIWTGNHLKYL